MWQGWGSRVIIVVVGDDNVREENGSDSHDPPCRKWGMHEGCGYSGPGVGGRDRCWYWVGVTAAGVSVVI